MNIRRKRTPFRLIVIKDFDARRGYKRCALLPGFDLDLARPGPKAKADFWRDRKGRLVARFSYDGYVLSLKASKNESEPITDRELEEFGWYIGEVLSEWVDEGPDDWPTRIYEYAEAQER